MGVCTLKGFARIALLTKPSTENTTHSSKICSPVTSWSSSSNGLSHVVRRTPLLASLHLLLGFADARSCRPGFCLPYDFNFSSNLVQPLSQWKGGKSVWCPCFSLMQMCKCFLQREHDGGAHRGFALGGWANECSEALLVVGCVQSRAWHFSSVLSAGMLFACIVSVLIIACGSLAYATLKIQEPKTFECESCTDQCLCCL